MFWFKNAMIYRLTKELDWQPAKLQETLQQNQYHPCQQQDLSKQGWINPLKDSELLYFSVGKQILLVAQKEDKLLPADVVNRALNERIATLEEQQQRKLKKNRKTIIKRRCDCQLIASCFQ